MSNWLTPYHLLDPSQKDFIDNYRSGNPWLVGYAGSGKSILLVHLLNRLKQESDRNHQGLRFGVVVFTHALGDLFRTGFVELGITGVPIMTQFELKRRSRRPENITTEKSLGISRQKLRKI